MRRGGRILVLLGIVLGIMTAGLVLLNLPSGPPPPPVETKPVLIAQQNIPARSLIPDGVLTVVQWPVNIIPPNAVTDPQLVIGRLAPDQIYQGQIILNSMIIDRGTLTQTLRPSPAAFVIPENKVAMAFQVTPLTSIANALQAGDYVDMLLTLSPPQPITQTGTTRVNPATLTGTEGENVTQLFLQDVLVLNVGNWGSGVVAANQQQQQQQQVANVVTFALDRQDSIVLKTARELGQIDLILRRAGDHRPGTTEPVTREYINRRFNFKLLPAIR